MSKIETLFHLWATNKQGILGALIGNISRYGFFNWMNDKAYLNMIYWANFGKQINWSNPLTFNEKIQWLKLYDQNQLYTIIVDKIKMKEWIKSKIGDGYIIPTLGVWETPDEIDIDILPNKFVLKWNHDSGSIVVCKDKTLFDKEGALKKLQRGSKVNGFWYGREKPYLNVPPKVFAEEYMEDEATHELRDYKIFTFNGVAKLLLVASERQKEGVDTKFDFYDMNLNHIDMRNQHENAAMAPEPPSQFNMMKELAETLSKGFAHLRVDFYEVNGHVFIGELTLYHGSGFMTFSPESWNYKLGSWINLPTPRE